MYYLVRLCKKFDKVCLQGGVGGFPIPFVYIVFIAYFILGHRGHRDPAAGPAVSHGGP